LRSRIKGALIYPIVLMSVSVAILLLLVTFALPKIANIFSNFDKPPPAFSRVVFAVGLFFGAHVVLILGSLILGTTIFVLLYLRSDVFRRFLYLFFIKLPVVKDIVTRIAIQRFATTFSSLLASGLPILDSLEITASAVGNEEIRQAILRISREGISKGLTIGESFKRETAFPRTVTNLISISEKSGHIEDILQTLGNFYETEIDASLKALVSLLEPALLMGIGAIIAIIALSIIIPIYQLVGQF
jgi:type II secretory pathway component PulF